MTALDMNCVRAIVAAPDRLSHLPPFLDHAPFAAAASGRVSVRASLAREWALEEDPVWLLAVGMMRGGDKLDSYRRLAVALARLGGEGWRLIVVGDGEARAEVEAAFADFGPRRVVFAGALDAAVMPAVFAAADIYAWPAVNEAYGMAMLEAQAVGLPVVAGDAGGVADVVCDGKTGFLIAGAAPDAFAERLQELIEDAGLRRHMGQAARAWIGADRTLARAGERLDRALQRACAR
jgi:glycosyltransferase involved in cell wall biosynthesis